MFEKLMNKIGELKMILSTGALLIATLVGGYNIASTYFVPMAYAKEMQSKFDKSMIQLKKQTLGNSIIILEMRMIRLETRIMNGEQLTPTEQRLYEKYKRDISKLENKDQEF